MFDDIYFHNTLSNHKERFTPQAAERVTLYVCGPTVYGPVHVGNARPAVVFDMLFRLLRRQYGVAAVRYARNITDIDDKIIAAAAINNEPPATLAARWHKDYHLNMQALSVLPPTDEPCATDYLPQMLAMIETLVQKKHAYEVEGHVLFHVSSYANHGVLSNRCREDMLAGARVEVAPYKRDPADFVLWKPSPPQQ
jgi:cysteinyl-tRNA synthetase